VSDGGNYTISIAETVIASDQCGYLTGNYTYVRRHISGTYTAAQTGLVNLEIHNWSSEGNPGKVHNHLDNLQVAPEHPIFEALNPEIVANEGGVFQFNIDAGSEYGNKIFIILQSFSGSDPGFYMNGGTVHVPLNPDIWTNVALNLNSYWHNFYGLLDMNGQAYAEMSTFGPQPNAELVAIHLVALVLEDSGFIPIFASNPVNVLFLPEAD
jgi:hypothetical protein